MTKNNSTKVTVKKARAAGTSPSMGTGKSIRHSGRYGVFVDAVEVAGIVSAAMGTWMIVANKTNVVVKSFPSYRGGFAAAKKWAIENMG